MTTEPRVLSAPDDNQMLVIKDGRFRFIDKDGADWDAVGWAPDGTVEAVVLDLVERLDATTAKLAACEDERDEARRERDELREQAACERCCRCPDHDAPAPTTDTPANAKERE